MWNGAKDEQSNGAPANDCLWGIFLLFFSLKESSPIFWVFYYESRLFETTAVYI